MASVIAHELEETVTDPQLNAWYDAVGKEDADKCAWMFGDTYPVPNGSSANMRLGSRDFLIQQNWVNVSGGYCVSGYPDNSRPIGLLDGIDAAGCAMGWACLGVDDRTRAVLKGLDRGYV
jgi:hypothetical protein